MSTLAASRPIVHNGGKMPLHRPLSVYAFDPTFGHSLGNCMVMPTKYEPLRPGPVGAYLAVIDYDANNRCYYESVDLDAPAILLQNGLPPSESDPRFHQQMVYAVASETIRRFEFALGRKIHWRADYRSRQSPYHGLLRIFPHAMQEANAYYDPRMRALLFGYFSASETESGDNLPGQTVFTCLSYDIVAHETTHALVDGLRDAFMDPSGPDTPAFHEAFADIVALFQHFSQKEALVETIRRTGGRIYASAIAPETKPNDEGALIQTELPGSNPLVDLAKQFGEAMGTRKALRSALGTRPNSRELERLFEPHDRGAILVAAVFDAFFSIYTRRIQDLFRIAGVGRNIDGAELNSDLVARLAKEAAKTAEQFLTICIRALDYCVPVGITFGEFLRALITADYDLVPDDPLGFRKAFIDAFRSRGIRPEKVHSYSEESLRWSGPDNDEIRCEDLNRSVRHQLDQNTFLKVRRENAQKLHAFGRKYADVFGLDPKLNIQPHSFHPIQRVGPDGQLEFEMVAELFQQRMERLDPDDPRSMMTVRGGATLLFNEDGTVRYAVRKSLKNEELGNRQRNFLMELAARSAGSTYGVANGRLEPNFASIHRGY